MNEVFGVPVKTNRWPKLAARIRSLRHGPHVAVDGYSAISYQHGRKFQTVHISQIRKAS